MENQNNENNAKQVEVINAVKAYNPELLKACYSVGLWIWAEFQRRLNQEELTFLKEAGFRWNPVRQVWQNACGVKKRRSTGDPRAKYQVISFSEN